jgi:hypothetical protein
MTLRSETLDVPPETHRQNVGKGDMVATFLCQAHIQILEGGQESECPARVAKARPGYSEEWVKPSPRSKDAYF